jgi:hypothetical protein
MFCLFISICDLFIDFPSYDFGIGENVEIKLQWHNEVNDIVKGRIDTCQLIQNYTYMISHKGQNLVLEVKFGILGITKYRGLRNDLYYYLISLRGGGMTLIPIDTQATS